MRPLLPPTLLALALAPLPTTAFVINTYKTTNCTGDATRVNVWDNSCAGWMGNFGSAQLQKDGGSGQIARIYWSSSCQGVSLYTTKVDGSNGSWAVGACTDEEIGD